MSELVLFGVGKHTAKFISIITYFGGKVGCLADNDEQKIGTMYNGLRVISTRALADMECRVIISCVHGREITTQLAEIGIVDRLVSLREYLNTLNIGMIKHSKFPQQILKDYTICMDLFSSAEWGGAEGWNMMLAKALEKKGKIVDIVKYFRSDDTFLDMMEYFRKKLPFVFVNSFFGDSFFAAISLKQLCQNNVRLISVIHNDQSSQYALGALFDEWTDWYICVSSRIKNTLIDEYHIAPEKVRFLYQPIEFNRYDNRPYNDTKPLRLGFASRLVSRQKRCDLLPQLICQLEETGIDYIFNIAGDGELFSYLQGYVSDSGLSDRVRLLGYLDKQEMNSFWMEQDLYINISEFEGTSLAMLEAMETGCVPVVTDISGVRDYISDGYNGFIFDVKDIDGMAARIKIIDQQRELLKELGNNARKVILSKCDVGKYADNLLEMIYCDTSVSGRACL